MIVVEQCGHELMRLATVKAIPTIEAAPERPARARGGHVRLVIRREMPFADRVRRVPVSTEHFGEEAVLARDPSGVAGVSDCEIGDTAHPVAVMIAAREQAGASRRAQRSRVEVREADAFACEP